MADEASEEIVVPEAAPQVEVSAEAAKEAEKLKDAANAAFKGKPPGLHAPRPSSEGSGDAQQP
jgi:hypothetical protein